MHLQWHNKDAASRYLWMETLSRCFRRKSPKSTVKVLWSYEQTSSAQVCKSPSRLLVNFSKLQPPSSSSQGLGFSSSLITHVPRFAVSVAVDVDGLPILRQRTCLFWCPPLGLTTALLWEDVMCEFWMSHHLNVTTLDRRRVRDNGLLKPESLKLCPWR